jgi:YD repeat-containing protein
MYRAFILFLTRATMSPRLRTATRLILSTCLWAASAGVEANEFFNTREAAGAACHAERARLQPPPPTCSQLRCDLFSETSDEGELIGPGYVLTSTCLGWTRIVDFFLYPRTACGPGEDFVAPGVCVAAPGSGAEGDKDLGCSAAGRAVGNPCDAATGNKYQSEDDYRSGDGLLRFTRHYNSALGQDAGLGVGWTSSVHTGLELSGTDVVIRQSSGRGEPFTCNGTGACSGDPDTKLLLDQDATGYTLTLPDGATERYDPDGRRLAETDRSGKSTSYSYDVAGRLQAVTGPFGRRLTFAYDAAGHLASMVDPGGGTYRYEYDANDNLTRVTYPDGTVRRYHYEDGAFAHHLTGITDANGDRVATYAYDANGKAILTQRAGGQQQFTLSYDSDTQSTVTDAIGTQEVLTFAETLGVKNLLSRINQSDDKGIRQAFDDNNNLIEATDAEGRITTYTYNANNQRLTMTAAAGTPEARTTTFAYVSEDIDLPTEVATPSVAAGQQRRVTTVYDANNNPTAITQAGFTPSGAPVTRIITMAYNALGQVIAIDGARTDVSDLTTLAYYECATGGECGQLKTLTNAAGHKTTYEAYDAHGRVMRLTDPNAVVTTFTYDLRGRVLSITRTPPVGPPRTTTNI